MPDFSFRLSRLLRPHRSSRSDSSSAKAGNDLHSPHPTLSSRPSSRQGALEQGKYIDTDHLDVGVTRGDSTRQPSPASPPITSIVTAKSISPDPAARTAVSVSPSSNMVESTQALHPSDSCATSLNQSVVMEGQCPPSSKDLTPLVAQHQSQEVFRNARDFSVVGSNFIDNTNASITNNINISNQFMKDLLKETIPGAAADSSARDPPPRCHPGTRLQILERCLHFIAHCEGSKKTRWVVGAAGVGKSAIMQSVTESPKLSVNHRASVFLSINGRDEGTKTIVTLSYQFAAKSQSYRRVIEDEINRDPSLLQSSMAVQFERFIVQPFIYNPDTSSTGRVLIIVDGLDECKDIRTQVELLRLISTFCISYPSSPIAWLIASRPEPHIVSFFAEPDVAPAYEKEEIAVDSNEGRADVERCLRHELTKIGRASSLDPQWPDEQHLWKLANAAGGLFAYAQTVIRYIGDLNVCDPASQLIDVLNVIDELPLSELSRDEHPMALLDALYARILSNVPPRIMINARKLLLALASGWDLAVGMGRNLIVLCNWLGMTANEAYTALNRLRAVLDFPERHEAHERAPEPFHKSFFDYLWRSGFSNDLKLEARRIMIQCASRVLKEAPDGHDYGTSGSSCYYGVLARCSGAGDKISFSWPAQDGIDWDDTRTRQSMYQLAIVQVAQGIDRGDPVFQTRPYIEILTTRFSLHTHRIFPFHKLCDVAFDMSRRGELLQHGILKQVPAKKIPISEISESFSSKMRFRCPVTATVLPDVWESSCRHERDGQYKQEEEQNWTTTFQWKKCTFCSDRLRRQLGSFIARFPDYTVPIMFTSSNHSWIEVRFVDPGDGVSEWTYWLPLFLIWDRRERLGSTI